MPAVQYNAKTPWTAALAVLIIIWTVWLLSPHSHSGVPALTPPKTHEPTVPASTESGKSQGVVPGGSPPKGVQKADRPLVLYAYSESEAAHDNLEFFVAHGLHANADFVFILNGETNVSWLLPNETNIKYVQRPNDCYDLGAYAEVLTKNNMYKQYKKFILLNASIRGPFIPYWASSCWSERYLSKVTDEVKLVGMTANCWPHFHVQSMIWATDIVGMEVLLHPAQPTPTPENPNPEPEVGINACFHGWDAAVHAEIGASTVIEAAGYKLDVMMASYHGDKDYVEKCDTSRNGDVLWNGAYKGTNVHPYETIFLKTNRNIDPILMDRLTDWTKGSQYSSYDHC